MANFKDIIGQDQIKKHLQESINKVMHVENVNPACRLIPETILTCVLSPMKKQVLVLMISAAS